MAPKHAMGTHSSWALLERATEVRSLRDLATITVIAALPSWGATTWMRQCQARIESHTGTKTWWFTNRRGIEETIADPASASAPVYFISKVELTDDDPLWEQLVALTQLPHRPRVVVRSLDLPPPLPVDDVHVMTEADLALSAVEVTCLAQLNEIDAPATMYASLTGRYRGNPALVRRRLEMLRTAEGSSPWADPDVRLDLHLVTELATRFIDVQPERRDSSTMMQLLRRASHLRRASAELLTGAHHDRTTVHANFERIRMLPLGTHEVDPETGQSVMEWHPEVWEAVQRYRSPDANLAALRDGLAATQANDHLGMQVYYLLALGQVGQAESLIWKNLRFFLLSPPAVIIQAITAVPWAQLRHFPAMLLIAGEYRSRQTLTPAVSEQFYLAALSQLAMRRPRSPFEKLQVVTRQVMAHMSLGQRSDTMRLLAEVEELLGDNSHPGLLSLAAKDATVAENLAAEMYIPFWAATQVDDNMQALLFTSVMRSHHNPNSRTAMADSQAALTHEVFLGYAPDHRDDLGSSFTDALVVLEWGDDERALHLTEFLAERRKQAPSRSVAEAFVLMMHAVLTPDSMDRRLLQDSLQRSSHYWADGRPSAAILGATTMATLAVGDVVTALRLIRSRPPQEWFTLTAEALVMLALDRAGEAMEAVEQVDSICTAPRSRAIAGAIAAVAHLRMDSPAAAVQRLEATLRGTSAGLLRVGLRFVTAEDFDDLMNYLDQCSPELARVLSEAATDTRHWHRATLAPLTPVDRENLKALRNGATNTEIAQQRFVSINTVRTQIRLLLRKLKASDRMQAVAYAERLGVFEQE
ncbi:LuxR C-terminal-related transcriptional regulator [Demequina sp. B12]|uniref:helix-turn-helix transcriptional regulator n=1 Tax=Demequina sp. B12 TaxID=2992757 RepID=UPI00237BCE17|nr:LuxR C-terminal-related transcriptional regulator [Demequina sp. B12]MDE0572699.1 LuxR C-terminal-related transcriptional regulator [Demequina sp. B12]